MGMSFSLGAGLGVGPVPRGHGSNCFRSWPCWLNLHPEPGSHPVSPSDSGEWAEPETVGVRAFPALPLDEAVLKPAPCTGSHLLLPETESSRGFPASHPAALRPRRGHSSAARPGAWASRRGLSSLLGQRAAGSAAWGSLSGQPAVGPAWA